MAAGTIVSRDAAAAFAVGEHEYLVHAEGSLRARIFRPQGTGPFPAMVEVHGGGWCVDNRDSERHRHEAFARAGIVAVVLQFRQAEAGRYPRAVADLNYGVRWVKANAAMLGTRAEQVGISGQSSGGHLAMLVAMRPRDPRYAAIPLPEGSPPVDAGVRCAVASWPVINPLGRYRMAMAERDRPPPVPSRSDLPPGWPESVSRRHERFWQSERDMAEGSPLLMLLRGEPVETPPVLWIQGRNDPLHDYLDVAGGAVENEPQRFVSAYRKAGGAIELHGFDAPFKFTSLHPSLPASVEVFGRMTRYIHARMAEASPAAERED